MNAFYRPEVIVDYSVRYEPSPVETVLNALILGTLVVTGSIVLALEGMQVAIA